MKAHSPCTEPASFLFTTWEGGGVVGPVLTVARGLADRGHQVRVMCESASRDQVEAAGLAFRPWKLAPNRPDRSRESCPLRDWEATTPQDGVARVIDHLMVGPAWDYARDVIAELDREPADVVVTSEMLPGVMAACESRGQRFAVFTANLCLYPIPGMPAFGPGLPPPATPGEEALHAAIMAGTVAMFDSGLASFNGTRRILGLEPLAHVTDQIHAADLYLLGTSRAFDFPVKQLPDRLHYVGPQIGEPAQPWISPWPGPESRPLVAVAFSTTFQNHAGVLQRTIDAAAGLPVRTLVTLSQIGENEVRAAANSVLVPSAPHDAVMREASVVVTHGGHGTVMRALVNHLPMLIIPHGRDQTENAIRITVRGAGLSLPPSASREEIAGAIRRLLEEPSFAAAARRLGSAVAQEIRDSPVVELLEALALKPRESACCAGRVSR